MRSAFLEEGGCRGSTRRAVPPTAHHQMCVPFGSCPSPPSLPSTARPSALPIRPSGPAANMRLARGLSGSTRAASLPPPPPTRPTTSLQTGSYTASSHPPPVPSRPPTALLSTSSRTPHLIDGAVLQSDSYAVDQAFKGAAAPTGGLAHDGAAQGGPAGCGRAGQAAAARAASEGPGGRPACADAHRSGAVGVGEHGHLAFLGVRMGVLGACWVDGRAMQGPPVHLDLSLSACWRTFLHALAHGAGAPQGFWPGRAGQVAGCQWKVPCGNA